MHSPRLTLRAAASFPFSKRIVRGCVKRSKPADALFESARIHGLNSIERIERSQRSGHLARVIGEVAESVAEIVERDTLLDCRISVVGWL